MSCKCFCKIAWGIYLNIFFHLLFSFYWFCCIYYLEIMYGFFLYFIAFFVVYNLFQLYVETLQRHSSIKILEIYTSCYRASCTQTSGSEIDIYFGTSAPT
mmetsp:Transcript_39/g.4  ORF Transcript_39/g.4 Transcript_39/m.4 type:complete len:100 (+) Transcript_39:93-392(+)